MASDTHMGGMTLSKIVNGASLKPLACQEAEAMDGALSAGGRARHLTEPQPPIVSGHERPPLLEVGAALQHGVKPAKLFIV